MRGIIAMIGAIGLSGCALSPGQLDPIKIHASQSCIGLVIIGNPLAGTATATATATVPVSVVPKLGLDSTDTAVPPGYAVTFTCKP